MRRIRNQILRKLLCTVFFWAEKLVRLENFFRRSYPQKQGSTSVPADYDGQQERLTAVFQSMDTSRFWAETSGTKATPKKIPYDRKRTLLLQKTFMKSMLTLLGSYRGAKTFFVLSSLTTDQSLTSGLLKESGNPSLIELLQAPYRYLQTTDGLRLREKIGNDAARIAVMCISSPRFLFATNPSTIAHLNHVLKNEWTHLRLGLNELLFEPSMLAPLLELEDGDGTQNLRDLAQRELPPELQDVMPKLQAMVSWDGGYVKVFLDQLQKELPRIDQIPMFSMSTEAVMTIPHRIGRELYFLPTAPKVIYEFMDQEGKILKAADLKVGQIYGMVVSDAWGLKSYDTQDLFRVKTKIGHLPDLEFVKRRGMTSSLTGEKLTEHHAEEMYRHLRESYPVLRGAFLTLFPAQKGSHFGYELGIIGPSVLAQEQEIATRAQELLGEINDEYHSKITSGRLLPIEVRLLTPLKLAKLMDRDKTWESQFKLLPLYEKLVRSH